MKRRNFIILTSLGAATASVLSACGHPEEKLIPALIPDEEYIPGIDYSKTTVCGMCPAGCGIAVRMSHLCAGLPARQAHAALLRRLRA